MIADSQKTWKEDFLSLQRFSEIERERRWHTKGDSGKVKDIKTKMTREKGSERLRTETKKDSKSSSSPASECEMSPLCFCQPPAAIINAALQLNRETQDHITATDRQESPSAR